MKAKFYKSPDQVLFFNPIERFLAKIFGAKRMVFKCKTCKKIPTEVFGGYCKDHIPR